MQGLKTQEGNKFIAFFKLIQEEARKRHSVFFLECGEGNEFETAHIEGEDLRGWLIPEKQAGRSPNWRPAVSRASFPRS